MSFLYDLKLLARFLGSGTCLGNVSAADLKEWLTYLLAGRGVPLPPVPLYKIGDA